MAITEQPSWKKKRDEKKPDEAAAPDAFQSTAARVIDKIVPHLKLLLLGLVALVLILVGYYTWNHFKMKKREKATAAFAQAVRIEFQGEVKENPDPPKEDDVPLVDPPPVFKTQEEKSKAFLSALDKVRSSYGGTPIATNAQLLRGATLYELGQFDEALKAFEGFLAKASGSDPFRFVGQEGAGYALEAKGNLDEALKHFTAMDPDPTKKGTIGEDRALLHQARIHAAKKDKAKATELLKKLIADFPTSSVMREAQDRLAMLESQS